MKTAKKMILIILVLAGSVFIAGTDVVEEIVAIVNDDIITLSQYKEYHETYYQMLRAQLAGEEFEKQYERIKKELMNSMITDLLLLQLAKDKQMNVSEQLKMTIENIKKENNIESDEELRREMGRQGINFDQWRKQMEENLMRQGIIFSEVDREIVIDDSEVVNYYKLNPKEFTEPEEYKIRAIYLSLEDNSESSLESRKKDINERLLAGGEMAELAGLYSDNPLKETQGDLGTFKKGELEKTLEEAVEKLKAGEITPWVKAKNGWYILKLEEKKDIRLKSFEEVKKDIEEMLFAEKRNKKLEEFLKELKERSYIKILKPDPLGL